MWSSRKKEFELVGEGDTERGETGARGRGGGGGGGSVGEGGGGGGGSSTSGAHPKRVSRARSMSNTDRDARTLEDQEAKSRRRQWITTLVLATCRCVGRDVCMGRVCMGRNGTTACNGIPCVGRVCVGHVCVGHVCVCARVLDVGPCNVQFVVCVCLTVCTCVRVYTCS